MPHGQGESLPSAVREGAEREFRMILVAGDAMTDRYHFGDVARISPEAPVAVLKVERTEERAGAAANVALNIEAMGVAVERVFSPTTAPVLKVRAIGRNVHKVRRTTEILV